MYNNNEEAIEKAIAASSVAKVIRENLKQGLKIALVGAVNAGKSSAINAIIGEEIAKVDAATGTTKWFNVYPLPNSNVVKLIDTPGLRDPKTNISLKRNVHNIDIVLYFVNTASGWQDKDKSDCFWLNSEYGNDFIIVVSRIDADENWQRVKSQIEDDIDACIIPICSKDGRGIDTLTEAISKKLERLQKSFLFQLVCRDKQKACSATIRETLLKVAGLAAMPASFGREIQAINDEIIQMIVNLILIGEQKKGDHPSPEQTDKAEADAKNFYREFRKRLSWQSWIITWGASAFKVLASASGITVDVISAGLSGGIFSMSGIMISSGIASVALVLYTATIGDAARNYFSEDIPSWEEIERIAKQSINGWSAIDYQDLQKFIDNFRTSR
ncbi:GTPase [Aerosakkonema sp. BLCC-F183]|uniref:GTPase n=1 Tax=Aerosakkonema sp. BLCC-F183 TaxID=3342834 RepID=UPI0035B72210